MLFIPESLARCLPIEFSYFRHIYFQSKAIYRKGYHAIKRPDLERIEEREKLRAKERELAGVKINPVETLPQGKTRDIVAQKVGWSGLTLAKHFTRVGLQI